jgi:hypothetical protein
MMQISAVTTPITKLILPKTHSKNKFAKVLLREMGENAGWQHLKPVIIVPWIKIFPIFT